MRHFFVALLVSGFYRRCEQSLVRLCRKILIFRYCQIGRSFVSLQRKLQFFAAAERNIVHSRLLIYLRLYGKHNVEL